MRAAGRRSAAEEERRPLGEHPAQTDRQVQGTGSPKSKEPEAPSRDCPSGLPQAPGEPNRGPGRDRRTLAPTRGREGRGRAPEPRSASSAPAAAIVDGPNEWIMAPMTEDHPVSPARRLVHHGPGGGHRPRHGRSVEEPHGDRPRKASPSCTHFVLCQARFGLSADLRA